MDEFESLAKTVRLQAQGLVSGRDDISLLPARYFSKLGRCRDTRNLSKTARAFDLANRRVAMILECIVPPGSSDR
jgi:hypothetical protein